MNKYTRMNWENTPSTATPLTADNLNHMDEGIERATDGAIALETEIATARGGQNSLGARLDKTDKSIARKLDSMPFDSEHKITARVISQVVRFTMLCLLKPIKPPWRLNTIRQILKVVHQHSHRIQPSPIKSKVQTVHIRRLVTS